MFICYFMVNGQRKQLDNLSLNPYVQIDRNRLLRLITNDPSEINDDILNIAAQVVQFYPDARQLLVFEEQGQTANKNGAKPEPKGSAANNGKPKRRILGKIKPLDLFYVSGNLSLCLLAAILYFFTSSINLVTSNIITGCIKCSFLSVIVIAVVLLLSFKETKKDRSFMFRTIFAVINHITSFRWIFFSADLFSSFEFDKVFYPIVLPIILYALLIIVILLHVSSLVYFVSLFIPKRKVPDGKIKKNIKPMPRKLILAIPTIASLCIVIGSAVYSTTPMDVIDGSTLVKVWNQGITSYVIPSSVTRIGEEAFKDRSSLASVTVPSSVTYIGDRAFYECDSLASVTIPSSVTYIGDRAFYYCCSLASVTIPSSVTSVGKGAFSDCSSLKSVSIPSSVTSIEENAFYNCTSLTGVSIPSSVTHIGNNAFYYCRSLTSVAIPSSVTSIGEGAFQLCSSLKSVTIPSSVTSIREFTFSECSSLKSVTIPSSVKYIGDRPFYRCNKLTDIYYSGTQAQWDAINKGSDSIPSTCVIHYGA